MSEAAESYGGFLREAIATHWRTRKGRRVRFLALLLASREAWEVAAREAVNVETARKLATGVAGVAAVTLLLRLLVGGPLGLLLTGASVAGLVTVFVRNQGEVRVQAARCRELVERYRGLWEDIAVDHRAGRVDAARRDLMIDGLLRRFLDELDADAPPAPPTEPRPDGGFSEHVAQRRRLNGAG